MRPFLLSLTGTVFLATIAGQALAATGTIAVTLNSNAGASVSKSSNISGPTLLRGTGSYTATFPSATNTSGYISADMTDANYESFCDSTFQTVVTNGVCRVVLGNTRGGQGHAVCTFALGSVNPSTCDFTATFHDTPGTASAPPN